MGPSEINDLHCTSSSKSEYKSHPSFQIHVLSPKSCIANLIMFSLISSGIAGNLMFLFECFLL